MRGAGKAAAEAMPRTLPCISIYMGYHRVQCLGKHHYHGLCDEVIMSIGAEVIRNSGLVGNIVLRTAQLLVGVVVAMAFFRVSEIPFG